MGYAWVYFNLRINFRTRAQRVPGTRDNHRGLTNGTPRVPDTLPQKCNAPVRLKELQAMRMVCSRVACKRNFDGLDFQNYL